MTSVTSMTCEGQDGNRERMCTRQDDPYEQFPLPALAPHPPPLSARRRRGDGAAAAGRDGPAELRRRRAGRRQAAPQRVRLHPQRRQRDDLAGDQGRAAATSFRRRSSRWQSTSDDFTVFSGLHHPNGLGQAHVCADTWLTGAKIDAQSARQYHNTVSCDQLMAEVTVAAHAVRVAGAVDQLRHRPAEQFDHARLLAATACRCRPRTTRATSSTASSAKKPAASPPSAPRLDKRRSVLDAVLAEAKSLRQRPRQGRPHQARRIPPLRPRRRAAHRAARLLARRAQAQGRQGRPPRSTATSPRSRPANTSARCST